MNQPSLIFLRTMDSYSIKLVAKFVRFYVCSYVFFSLVREIGIVLKEPKLAHISFYMTYVAIAFTLSHLALYLKYGNHYLKILKGKL